MNPLKGMLAALQRGALRGFRRDRTRYIYICTWLFIFSTFSFLHIDIAHAERYLKPKECLERFFQNSEKVTSTKKTLDEATEQKIAKRLKRKLKRTDYTFYIGKTGNKIDGYAVIDHQIGKSHPFTYMVLISPAGEVKQIELLAYREPQGFEIKYPKFLQQFYGKKPTDRLKVGREIKNISGATLSVRSITRGVQEVLTVWSFFFA